MQIYSMSPKHQTKYNNKKPNKFNVIDLAEM